MLAAPVRDFAPYLRATAERKSARSARTVAPPPAHPHLQPRRRLLPPPSPASAGTRPPMREPHPAPRSNLPFRLSVPENDPLALHVVYALYAAAVVFAIPGMFGVLLAYLKRRDVGGTYLDSHVVCQTRSFWFCLDLWLSGCFTVLLVVGLMLLSPPFFWFFYRLTNVRKR